MGSKRIYGGDSFEQDFHQFPTAKVAFQQHLWDVEQLAALPPHHSCSNQLNAGIMQN